MKDLNDDSPRYAIREVSEMTGIKPVTLRAWQRRYGLIQPKRTQKGHRLFSQQDIDAIREIQGWINKGVLIGKVKELIRGGSQPDQSEGSEAPLKEVDLLLESIAKMDAQKGDKMLSSLFKEYPTPHIVNKVIYPVQDALEAVKGTQRSLQMALFRSLMMSVSNRIIDAENKYCQSKKVPQNQNALLVSFDAPGSVDTRIHALLLSDTGKRVTILEGVEEVSGLPDMLDAHAFSLVYFHCSKNISSKIASNIKALSSLDLYEVGYSPIIQQVYFNQIEE
ncbi:MerR family transcriptional regulator [Vibrio sp. S9_S30]|uniref:MerR family transcriptional regulator n=1 Tax=Vibrio sp. S9_S30 TaxID=2720226 RepID=UPI001680D6A0|nr:MerR family transcriptional regulator [Vibrio sp. S9_S30]MBD1556317.1 MerR family transcriptional regulator [Vibrio sp. S9_S30]